MLATLVDEPFHSPGWTYEEKYDGIRMLAYKEGSQVTLLNRNNKDRTEGFPAIAQTADNLIARRRSYRNGPPRDFTLSVAATRSRSWSLRRIRLSVCKWKGYSHMGGRSR